MVKYFFSCIIATCVRISLAIILSSFFFFLFLTSCNFIFFFLLAVFLRKIFFSLKISHSQGQCRRCSFISLELSRTWSYCSGPLQLSNEVENLGTLSCPKISFLCYYLPGGNLTTRYSFLRDNLCALLKIQSLKVARICSSFSKLNLFTERIFILNHLLTPAMNWTLGKCMGYKD